MALSQNKREWVRFLVLELGADLNLVFGDTTYMSVSLDQALRSGLVDLGCAYTIKNTRAFIQKLHSAMRLQDVLQNTIVSN